MLRVRVIVHPSLEKNEGTPWVLCFWHGTQLAALGARRRRATVAMVSHSADGAMQSVVMKVLGLAVVRGSSSRGGAAGLRAMLREMKVRSGDAAFAVDGPRGPLHVAKNGAVAAARLSRGRLVPVGAASARSTVLAGAWDRFALPWPLTRVAVVFGEPVDATHAEAAVLLGRAIDACNAQASRSLAGGSLEVSRRW